MQNLPSRFGTMVKEELENRPDNTAFTQQRLPAWQPMLSAGIVIPGFLIIGLAFIGIGVALFVTSRGIQVLEVWLQMRNDLSFCFTLNFPSLTSHPEPASLYLIKEVWCQVRVKGKGVAAINNVDSCSFLTSWNTRENSRPPPATGALIQLSRTVCAIWNSPSQPCSRLDPNTCEIFSWIWALLTLLFSLTGTRVFLLWFIQLFPELQKIWCVQRCWAAVWRLG